MFGEDAREDLARACRVLAHHEMIDLWGHASARVSGRNVVLTTPRFTRECLPRNITADDILVTDFSGKIDLEGTGALPRQFAVDLAAYRDDAVGAVIFGSPATAMAAAMSRYRLAPLTHMESSVAYELATYEGGALGDAGPAASDIGALLHAAPAVNQPGVGVWARGKDVLDALMQIYHLEYLAQANLVAAQWHEPSNSVERSDSDKLWRQFSGHHHYAEFFSSLDPGPLAHPYEAFVETHAPSGDAASLLHAAIAFSCRALWTRGTLVAFLEHISHRLPEENRFVMTAAKNFRDITPEDLCLLDYEANWLGGPKPPGFKWFHAQIMAERRDAQAVVHTHDLLGRVYALGQRKLVPAYRTGLEIAMQPLPAYPRCDLIVDADVRRQTIDALDGGPVVHEIAHGTDFVSDTLERAVVDAIQREAFLRMHHLAERFGTPRPLPGGVHKQLRAHEPNAVDWWWFYAAEVDAPRRSAGGL